MVDNEPIEVGHWTFKIIRASARPTLYYEGPHGVKGFLSVNEVQQFLETMKRIHNARAKLNRFPFPKYSHETLMNLLELISAGEKH